MKIMRPSTVFDKQLQGWWSQHKASSWWNSCLIIHWYISDWNSLVCTSGKSCFLSQTGYGSGPIALFFVMSIRLLFYLCQLSPRPLDNTRSPFKWKYDIRAIGCIEYPSLVVQQSCGVIFSTPY